VIANLAAKGRSVTTSKSRLKREKGQTPEGNPIYANFSSLWLLISPDGASNFSKETRKPRLDTSFIERAAE